MSAVSLARVNGLVMGASIVGTSVRSPRAVFFILRAPTAVSGRSASSRPVTANVSLSSAIACRMTSSSTCGSALGFLFRECLDGGRHLERRRVGGVVVDGVDDQHLL